MDKVWSAIVEEALKRGLETSAGAVPGAKLRELVARTAFQRGVSYPPSGYEDEKFGDFLRRFDSQLIVRRRDGQDLLVAPVDRPDLLHGPGDGVAQLRADIFEAFTRIPRGSPPQQPWYARDADAVRWFAEDETPDPDRFTQIPPATMAQELADREAFSRSAEVEKEARDRLLATLVGPSALISFSEEVRAHGLARKWHFHRLSAVIGRIKKWCEAERIPWRDEWIDAAHKRPQATGPEGAPATTEQGRMVLGHFVDSLSDEELRRISVPLDVVLRLLQK